MFNRWIEEDSLLDTLEDLGVGSIAFTPLAQGMLTKKYLNGVPNDSRAMQGKNLDRNKIKPGLVKALNELNAIASSRGQSLAKMALAWVLRGGRVITALIGASKSIFLSQVLCITVLCASDQNFFVRTYPRPPDRFK